MNVPDRQGPLARFKVIDLSRVRAGPTAVRQLADWGADVIKVESPEGDAGMGGERHGPDFQNLHRNKRSMTLNLKSPEGVAILKRLVHERRRAGGELPPRCEVPPRHRLRDAATRSIRGWSMPASRASARTGRIASVPASTRSRRAWAG